MKWQSLVWEKSRASKEECEQLGWQAAFMSVLSKLEDERLCTQRTCFPVAFHLLSLFVSMQRARTLPGLLFTGLLPDYIGWVRLYAVRSVHGDSYILPHAANGAVCLLCWQWVWISSLSWHGISVTQRLQAHMRQDTGTPTDFSWLSCCPAEDHSAVLLPYCPPPHSPSTVAARARAEEPLHC